VTTARPHGGIDELQAAFPFGIAVSRSGLSKIAAGVATCVVRRSSDAGHRYILSCRHVLSLSLVDDTVSPAGIEVRSVNGSLPVIGQATALRGGLEGREGDFDAQLARLTAPADAQRAMFGLSFERSPAYVGSWLEMKMESGFWVATGRRAADGKRHMVWVAYEEPVANFTMEYTLAHGVTRMITHALTFRGTAQDVLAPGDSGSPAVLTRNGGRLMGMYIGGDGVNAYVIPAWQLLDPRNFGVTTGETWTLS
jgi:hypothetical protein